MTILGIDPGTARAGFGVLRVEKGKIELISCGLLAENIKNHNDRLCEIRKRLIALIKNEKPERAVIETLFFSKNKKTGIFVAEARGVIMETITEFGIPTVELAPNQIKLALTGNGAATKSQIKRMLSLLLKSEFLKTVDDATDAVAAAFAGSQNNPYN